jgi:hypothetical protein
MRASPYEGGNVLEVPAGADDETATLVWLMGALEWARKGGHERLAGYLEAVADDVVFEVEAAARGALTASNAPPGTPPRPASRP